MGDEILASREIAKEIMGHIDGMALFSRLARLPSTFLRELPHRLNDSSRLFSSVYQSGGLDGYGRQFRTSFAASSETNVVTPLKCFSRVLERRKSEVLTDFDVVLAASEVTLKVSFSSPDAAFGPRRKRNVDGLTESFTELTPAPSYVCLKVELHSLHLVGRGGVSRTESLAAGHGETTPFVLQSVYVPECPLALQCYARHMVQFGLLGFALWFSGRSCAACSLGEVEASRKMGRPSREGSCAHCGPFFPLTTGNVATSLGNVQCQGTTSTTKEQEKRLGNPWLDSPRQLLALPTDEDSGVLILGLGGNAVGLCLDSILPSSVPIDIVELEPAVVRMCEAHGRLPPLESCAEGDTALFRARPGHHRFPNLRIIVGDVSRVLHGTPFGSTGLLDGRCYRMIFLDCYDPNAETMMHEQSLLMQCKAKLCAGRGGCLVVNAHIVAAMATIEPFLACHFAAIQVLRVRDCDQCILLCFTEPRGVTGAAGHQGFEPVSSDVALPNPSWRFPSLQDRFTVRGLRLMASAMNWFATHLAECPDRPFRQPFHFDGEWFKSSRVFPSTHVTQSVRLWELHP